MGKREVIKKLHMAGGGVDILWITLALVAEELVVKR